MRMPILLLAMVSVVATVAFANLTATPQFIHPLIQEHGKVVVLPDTAEQPQPNTKVLFDIAAAEEADVVIKGLDRVARLVNQYAAAEVDPKQDVKVALVFHGAATKAALTDRAYAKHTGARQNPNLTLLRQLQQAGVEMFVCGQALAHHGYGMKEVSPAVTVAASAMTVVINKQTEDYAYLPFRE